MELEVTMIDVITWVKDGAKYLPCTLKRLEEVLPPDQIHRKIAVDDRSQDESVSILKDFNWEVYRNPVRGISCGANYALSKVDCPFFMSFEQDLYLAKNWWNLISPLLNSPNVVAGSGIRFSTTPKPIRKLEFFRRKKYMLEKKLNLHLKSRKLSAFCFGKTIDNTLFQTEIIRKIGGFSQCKWSTGIDTILAFKLDYFGYEWQVNPYCVSEHIRKGLKQEFSHQRWYAKGACETRRIIVSNGYDSNKRFGTNYTFKQILKNFCVSPFGGAFLTVQTKNPLLFIIHPITKLLWVIGYIEGKE